MQLCKRCRTRPEGAFAGDSHGRSPDSHRSRRNRRHARCVPNCSTSYADTSTGIKLHPPSCASCDITRDADELTQTAGEYEQVPDAMSVPDALVVDEEVDACAIDDSAS